MEPLTPIPIYTQGGVAGAMSRTCVSPLERMKILFQIQTKANPSLHTRNRVTNYVGVWSTLRKIYVEEGVIGYFRGNGANVLRMIPYSAVQFGVFESLRKVIPRRPGCTDLDTLQRLYAGAISGAASVIATYPLDLIRTRLSMHDAMFLTSDAKGQVRPRRPGIFEM